MTAHGAHGRRPTEPLQRAPRAARLGGWRSYVAIVNASGWGDPPDRGARIPGVPAVGCASSSAAGNTGVPLRRGDPGPGSSGLHVASAR